MSTCNRCCCWSSPKFFGNSEWLASSSNDDDDSDTDAEDCQEALPVTSSGAPESNDSEGTEEAKSGRSADPPTVASLAPTAQNRKKHMQKQWTAKPKSWNSTEGIKFTRLGVSFEQDPKYSKELEHIPTEIKPCGERTFSERLEDADIQSIRGFFSQDEDSPLLATASHFGSFQFMATTWSNGTSGKRRFSFMAKPRENAHAAMVKTMGPATALVIMWVQMDSSEDSVRILQTSATPEVDFGSGFVVDEYLTFTQHPKGGVKFEFHTHVRWIKTYNKWMNPKFAFAEGLINSEPKHAGRKSADFLVRHLQELQKLQAQQPETPERTVSQFLSPDEQTSQVRRTGSQKIFARVASPRAPLLADEAGRDDKIKRCLEKVVIAEQELVEAKQLLQSISDIKPSGDTDEFLDASE